MQVPRGKGWRNTWSLSLCSFRRLPEDMQRLIAYRVRGYAANPSAPRTCCPAHRSHASGRVFQVHEPAGVFSVHISRRVQRNPVNGVGQNSSTEPARCSKRRDIRCGALSATTWNGGSKQCLRSGRRRRTIKASGLCCVLRVFLKHAVYLRH